MIIYRILVLKRISWKGKYMTHDPIALYVGRGFHRDFDDVRYAEEKGFDEIWTADVVLERDSITMMAAYAVTTTKVKLGTAVTPIWGRNPAILAVEAASIWDTAPGRIKLGLGAWWEPIASQVGENRRKNLTAMREIIVNIRKLLNLERVTYSGEHVHFKDVEMAFLTKEPHKRPVPIYIGATGLKMNELAGEIADGTVLNYMVSTDYIKKCVDHVKIGAERGGRKLADVDRPQLVAVSLSEDREKAMDAARVDFTQYLGREPHIIKASGVSQDVIDRVSAELTYPYTLEQVKKASRHVPDEAVQHIIAAGTPDECRKIVREYVRAGTTIPILSPVLHNAKEVIDAFADGFM